MKLTITTTVEDEVHEVMEVQIPAEYREEVQVLTGGVPTSRIQEISLDAAADVAELVYLDISELSGDVRCWLEA